MPSRKFSALIAVMAVVVSAVLVSCRKSSNNSDEGSYVPPVDNPRPLPITGNENNVLPIVLGSGYFNEPTVSVTICQPGSTTNCVTISNLLLDTGSFGLRVFASLIPFALTKETYLGGEVAECFPYADGTADWGPVVSADVIMGGQRASNIYIQEINSSYGNPSSCANSYSPALDLDVDPSGSGYNGVIGVGVFAADCGSICSGAGGASAKVYFTCSGSSCTPRIMPDANQVVNPVTAMPAGYNNGVALQLNPVSTNGAGGGAFGYLVLGIAGTAGSQADNTPPSGVQTMQTDSNANFQTTINGWTYPGSFIDSGTNTLAFPMTGLTETLPDCGGQFTGFVCPSSLVKLSAVQAGASGSPLVPVSFYVNSAISLLGSGNSTFNDIATSMTGSFDWGLPFFLGRTVYVGFEGTTSVLGTGPYWAF